MIRVLNDFGPYCFRPAQGIMSFGTFGIVQKRRHRQWREWFFSVKNAWVCEMVSCIRFSIRVDWSSVPLSLFPWLNRLKEVWPVLPFRKQLSGTKQCVFSLFASTPSLLQCLVAMYIDVCHFS